MGQTIYFDTETRNKRENKENIEKKKKAKKRLLMQIFVVLLIYICFYVGTNREYIFSEEFKKDVNSFFTEKTKIYEMYIDTKTFFEKNVLKKHEENENEENVDAEKQENIIEEKKEKQVEENNTGENVGGAEELKEETSKINEETGEENKEKLQETKQESQMEKDTREIKSKLSFIKPIEGRISSSFGWRNPTVSTVPKYHTGLDISAVEGTVIKSMTDGIIEIASSEGDYGKHYIVKYDNITLIYGHCSKLYLKQGTEIKQGQKIAEVGTTGNSTGPHLHIGIKLDDRWVDPQLILDI